MTKFLRTASFLAMAFTALAQAKTIHFDANYAGADADGSSDHPWRTLDKCFGSAIAGDVCLLEPGAYNLATPTGGTLGRVQNSGLPAFPIRVEARLQGTVFIGAWHELDWNETQSGSKIWVGTFRTPLAATISSLQSVWSDRLAQSGVRLWYLDRRVMLPRATWPRLDAIFPRMAYLDAGSMYNAYTLSGLPSGSLVGANVHFSRLEEEGAILRTVSGRPSTNVLSISNGGFKDQSTATLEGHRVWISDHPDLLDPELDQGRWTWDPANNNVRVAYHMDPDLTSLVLQISSVGPDLAGRAYWTFSNITFLGVVPVDDSKSAGIRYEGVTFQNVGLNNGQLENEAYLSDPVGLVLNGSSSAVDRCDFSMCPSNCIEIHGAMSKVTNSVFTYSQLNGGAHTGTIHVMGPSAEVRNNRLDELGVSGIVLNTDANNARISQNLITNWGRISHSHGGGIVATFRSTGSVEIDSNMIFNQSVLDAIRNDPLPGGAINLLFGRNKAFVHHNIIDGAQVGIRLGGYMGSSEDNSQENTIVSNDVGANTTYSWLRVQMQGSTPYSGTSILNNIFRTTSGYKTRGMSHFAQITPVSVLDPIPGGVIHHNLSPAQDPLFVAPTSPDWDFRLTEGSPAIDAGVSYNLPDLTPLPYAGTAPDAGAIEYGTNWSAGVKPPPPCTSCGPKSTTPFNMDDTELWTIPADEEVTTSSDKTEGAASFSVTAAGYKLLESDPVTQNAVGGTGFISFDYKIPSLQANPWWVGAVQFYVESPSRGLWNQWIGQIELTGLTKDEWHTGRLAIPAFVAQQLADAAYSDLKVRVAVNLNPGSGALGLDNIRFEN